MNDIFPLYVDGNNEPHRGDGELLHFTSAKSFFKILEELTYFLVKGDGKTLQFVGISTIKSGWTILFLVNMKYYDDMYKNR